MLGLLAFGLGVVPLTIMGGALVLLWVLRLDVVKFAARKWMCLEVDLEDANVGFLVSPPTLVAHFKGLTLFTPGVGAEEAKARADRLTARIPELRVWLEYTPGPAEPARFALAAEAAESDIYYVYLSKLSTETNFDRVIAALRGPGAKPKPEGRPGAGADERRGSGEVLCERCREKQQEEGEEDEKKRALVAVRRVVLHAPARVHVRGGGLPLSPPLNLGSVPIDPAALSWRDPAAFFIWFNERILLAIASSGADLVAAVGGGVTRAVGAGAGAVVGGGAAVLGAVGDGARALGDGAMSQAAAVGSALGIAGRTQEEEEEEGNGSQQGKRPPLAKALRLVGDACKALGHALFPCGCLSNEERGAGANDDDIAAVPAERPWRAASTAARPARAAQ